MDDLIKNKILKILQPGMLLFVILMYVLGVGIFDYLGGSINWNTFLIGLIFIGTLQISIYFLKVFYDYQESPLVFIRQEKLEKADVNQLRRLRAVLVMTGISFLTISAIFAFFLIQSQVISIPAMVLILLFVFLFFFYAVPPIRLVNSGYGEIIEAVLFSNIVPALGFLFQCGDLHRLLAMATFPVTLLFIIRVLTTELPEYAADQKYGRKTLLTRMGWVQGMTMHNILVLLVYVLLAAAMLLGFPWVLGWPALLTLPIGIYQILQIRQIGNGAKPNWKILSLTSSTLLGLTAYLLAFSFWIR